MNLFRKWSSREYPLPVRLVVLLLPGILLVFLIPYLLLVTLPQLDSRIGLPRVDIGVGNPILAGLFVALGLFLAWWSIGDQLFRAKGTPLPVMPTQILLIKGPFRLCRNPMTLGTILAYLGLAIWAGSIFSLVLVLIIAVLLILYLKLLEEHELELRFGQEYVEYKKNTPFLIPRFTRKEKA
jgi:protein-S-isoprenylcysteine O-methyltransferase Ste14